MFAVAVFVNDTCKTVCTVYTFFAFNASSRIIVTRFYGQVDTISTVHAVCSGRACQADVAYAILTGNRNCFFTIFVSNSYLAICTVRCVRTCNRYAILTIFANLHRFSFKVFIHLHVDSRIACCRILFDESFKVFTTVVSVSCSAFTLNCNSRS